MTIGDITIMIATLYKDNKPVKSYSDITRVEANDKYGYFELYQKIYHHVIIFVKPYREIDMIITKEKGEYGKEIIKEYRPHATH